MKKFSPKKLTEKIIAYYNLKKGDLITMKNSNTESHKNSKYKLRIKNNYKTILVSFISFYFSQAFSLDSETIFENYKVFKKYKTFKNSISEPDIWTYKDKYFDLSMNKNITIFNNKKITLGNNFPKEKDFPNAINWKEAKIYIYEKALCIQFPLNLSSDKSRKFIQIIFNSDINNSKFYSIFEEKLDCNKIRKLGTDYLFPNYPKSEDGKKIFELRSFEDGYPVSFKFTISEIRK